MMRAGQGGAGAGSSLMRSVTRSLPASSPAPDSTLGLPHQCTPTNKVTKATCHSGSEPPESPADTQGFASPGECLQCGGGPSYAAPTLRTISLSPGNRDKKRLLTCDSFFLFLLFYKLEDNCFEEGMATHCSMHAWRITEEPGGLQSMGSHRAGHD